VAEPRDKSKKQSGDPAATPPSGAEAQPGAQPGPASEGAQQRIQVDIDDVGAVASYANFCRVTGTPEEMIIDFGLNPQPFAVPTQPIRITQRIITNFYTAKRLLHTLQLTIQRHEAAFGVLETDVQKRFRPGAFGPPSGQGQRPPAGPPSGRPS